MTETYRLTEKGVALVEEIIERYRAGESVEDIAASHELTVDHVKLLMFLAEGVV